MKIFAAITCTYYCTALFVKCLVQTSAGAHYPHWGFYMRLENGRTRISFVISMCQHVTARGLRDRFLVNLLW